MARFAGSYSEFAMDRRTFAALASFGFALPRLIGSARADQIDPVRKASGNVAPTTPSADLSVDEIVARVEAFYEQVTTFKASFNQRLPHDWAGKHAGLVLFERPGKMSWRYTQSGNRVVSDGTRVRIYERENKQLYELDVAASQYPAALSFLSAPGKLRQAFAFTMPKPARMGGEGRHVLLAEPLQPSPAFERVAFFIDVQSYEVRRVLLIDAQGNKNRFDFAAGKLNLPVPASEFVFSAPPGTQILTIPSHSRTRP